MLTVGRNLAAFMLAMYTYFSSLFNLFIPFVCRHYFEGYPQLTEQTTYLTEYVNLLEQQISIEVKTTPSCQTTALKPFIKLSGIDSNFLSWNI